jgi:arsenical pump membrane protein
MPITSALAVGIFVGSLALLLLRHSRVPDWSAALGGGVLMVVVGVLPLGDALSQLGASWNVVLFFLGLGLSAATADRAGVFRAAAESAARLGRGSSRGRPAARCARYSG